MKKLHILVLKSYTKPLVMTFSIAIFILLMQFLWKYMEDMVGKGLEWSVIAELLLYSTAGLVPLALPLAVLMSALMTFGNLGQSYELLALKAAGISLQRIMQPLVIFMVFISISAFFFANNVMPYTQLQSLSLLYDVTQKKPEVNIKTGVFNNDIEGYTIRVKDRSDETGMMYDLMLYDHDPGKGNVGVTIADSAKMVLTKDKKQMLLKLYSGSSYNEIIGRQKKRTYNPMQRDTFSRKQLVISMAGLDFKRTNQELFSKNFQMLNVSQLDNAIDSLHKIAVSKGKRMTNSLKLKNYLITKKKDSVHKNRFKQHPEFYKNFPADSMKIILDLDSLFEAKPLTDKQFILNEAVERATLVQKEIDYNKEYMIEHLRYLRRHEIEWHKKYVLAFSSFIFFFIGAPLGAIIRKGGLGMPVVISTLFFVAYYIVSLTGEKMVRESVLPAWQGMWLAPAVLLPLGIYFTYKATYDSSIMESETYLKFFEKITKFLNKLLFWKKQKPNLELIN